MDQLRFKSSPIIAGCMRWGLWGARMEPDTVRSMIEDCLSAGIDTFDHADIYGGLHSTEAEFGSIIGANPSLREQMNIITKCGICLPDKNAASPRVKHYNTSSEHIIRSAEQSLSALQTDRIDLFLIHRPDPLMQPAEMAEAFYQLTKAGKVLHVGVSNFKGSQLRMLRKYWPIEVNQLQLSLEHPHALFDGSIDTCMELGIGVQAWSPLGAGTIVANSEDERLRKIDAAASIVAQKYGIDVTQVLLAWIYTHPAGIIGVLGTSRSERIRSAINASHIRLEKEEWFMLLRASMGRDVA
jgi:predicted oxidoreductase